MVVRPGENPHRIIVTNDTMEMMERYSNTTNPFGSFVRTGTRRPDGRWDIWVGDEVYDRLLALLEGSGYPGDDLSSVIDRLIREALGRKPS